MVTADLDEIREGLRESMRAAHAREMVPFGRATGADLFERAERFADDLTEHADDIITYANERGFEKLFAAMERIRRATEAVSAKAFNAVDERGIHHSDGHRSPQAFLQASVNVSNRERVERRLVAELVAFCPQVGVLLADGTLPVGHAVALGQLVANERIDRDDLAAALSGFLLTAHLTPHDVFARRVRSWGRAHDFDGAHPETEASHRHRNVRLSNVLDAFVLEGRFGTIQGAKLQAILQAFVDIEFDRDWHQAREIHGDDTCVAHLRRTPAQRRADALEAIFLAAIGQGAAKDVEIIINIVTDAHTFICAAAHAAAAVDTVSEAAAVERVSEAAAVNSVADAAPDRDCSAGGPVSEPSPAAAATAQRRFCHTLDGVDVNPLAAVQAAIDGHFRALIVGDDGVIINQGRKQRLFRGNTRVAARLQAGMDNLTRCSYPGCRATPRHIDHATEWASPDAGCTDVANSNLPCAHHNLWKSAHGYTVRRDQHGVLRTYRPDGTELRPS